MRLVAPNFVFEAKEVEAREKKTDKEPTHPRRSVQHPCLADGSGRQSLEAGFAPWLAPRETFPWFVMRHATPTTLLLHGENGYSAKTYTPGQFGLTCWAQSFDYHAEKSAVAFSAGLPPIRKDVRWALCFSQRCVNLTANPFLVSVGHQHFGDDGCDSGCD